MDKVGKIWMDGEFIAWDKAKIHVLTHGFHYGGGAFEGIRFYHTDRGTAIFRLDDHIDRLLFSASCLEMTVKYSKKQIIKAIIDAISINKIKGGYIRPIIYYGYGKMGLNPIGCPVNFAIAVWPWGAYLGTKPIKVKISSFIRIHPKSTISEAKICGTYFNSILASLDIKKQGYDEALLMDYKGRLAEGPGENVFIVKNNVLLTPKSGAILSGITRKSVFEIAKGKNIKFQQKNITKRILYSADEAFFTGTAAEITPIRSIDDRMIGKKGIGPITKILKDTFTDAVHGRIPKYEKWLTFIK